MSSLRETRFYRTLRNVPLPLLAIWIGLASGLLVWLLLDAVQTRSIREIFSSELELQLDRRARESLTRFDHYVKNYRSITQLLAKHRLMGQYLLPLAWSEDKHPQPLVYRDRRPLWLPDPPQWQSQLQPGYVLLLDLQGQIREIYQVEDADLPLEALAAIDRLRLNASRLQAYLTSLDYEPFLLVSDEVEDASGFAMGSLMMVVPVDERFLAASQQGVSSSGTEVAIVDGDLQRILASSNEQRLPAGSPVSQWSRRYVVTSQSFSAYDSADLNIHFATFVPRSGVETMAQRILRLERRQRFVEAAVFVGVFTLVFYLVSYRLQAVLRRISAFSQRALGIEQPVAEGGNQLLLLEEWIRQFIQLVRRARDEMRLQHESEIRDTEAIKSAILETSMDSIISIDGAGRIIEFNPTAENTFGYRRDEVLDRELGLLLIAEENQQQFLSILDSCRPGGQGPGSYSRGELVAVRSDRTSFPAEISIMPILLGKQLVYTVYLHDITKRKKAEREIASLAKFTSESPSPVLRINARGVIVYANLASDPLLTYWGCSRAQTLPLYWRNKINQAMQSGRNFEFEVDCGGQIYSLLFAPVVDLKYVNIYGRDITAVRIAEQQSRQHQAELVHVCRLSTMGEMATGLAHELNQPLSAIVNFANGCSRRLQSGSAGGEELVGAMRQITAQAERAGEIIKRLRGLVGKQLPVRRIVALNELVREVASFVEFEARKLGLVIELELCDQPLQVRVDLVQIEQVVLNLVRNALDALLEVDPDRRRLVIRTAEREQGAAIVEVRDNGNGMDATTMARLFDAFFTTKDGGMGMGLPISKTIIDEHNGNIWVESTLGKGTSFFILLPPALGMVEPKKIAGVL